MSDVGNVCKQYSLSKDNTHSTVSSHHNEEVREFKRIHQKQGGQPWKREEHMTRERLATSEKKESQKLCDGTKENTEWPRESSAGTFHFFFDVTQKQRN